MPNTLKLQRRSKIPQLTPDEFRRKDARFTKNQIIDAKHSPSTIDSMKRVEKYWDR